MGWLGSNKCPAASQIREKRGLIEALLSPEFVIATKFQEALIDGLQSDNVYRIKDCVNR